MFFGMHIPAKLLGEIFLLTVDAQETVQLWRQRSLFLKLLKRVLRYLRYCLKIYIPSFTCHDWMKMKTLPELGVLTVGKGNRRQIISRFLDCLLGHQTYWNVTAFNAVYWKLNIGTSPVAAIQTTRFIPCTRRWNEETNKLRTCRWYVNQECKGGQRVGRYNQKHHPPQNNTDWIAHKNLGLNVRLIRGADGCHRLSANCQKTQHYADDRAWYIA